MALVDHQASQPNRNVMVAKLRHRCLRLSDCREGGPSHEDQLVSHLPKLLGFVLRVQSAKVHHEVNRRFLPDKLRGGCGQLGPCTCCGCCLSRIGESLQQKTVAS